jgi:hypothetical protein
MNLKTLIAAAALLAIPVAAYAADAMKDCCCCGDKADCDRCDHGDEGAASDEGSQN